MSDTNPNTVYQNINAMLDVINRAGQLLHKDATAVSDENKALANETVEKALKKLKTNIGRVK